MLQRSNLFELECHHILFVFTESFTEFQMIKVQRTELNTVCLLASWFFFFYFVCRMEYAKKSTDKLLAEEFAGKILICLQD